MRNKTKILILHLSSSEHALKKILIFNERIKAEERHGKAYDLISYF